MSSPKTRGTRVQFRSNADVAIQVPDLARAEAFYAAVLNFTVVSERPEQLEIDTGLLRLYVNRDDVPRSFIPSFDVSDYRAAKHRLDEAGCATVRARAGQSTVVYFLDPFGFAFDIVERR